MSKNIPNSFLMVHLSINIMADCKGEETNRLACLVSFPFWIKETSVVSFFIFFFYVLESE